MSRHRFGRRALLAAAGSSVALPWLEAFAQKTGGVTTPQRLVIVVTPNGYLRDRWLPPGSVSTSLGAVGPTMQPVDTFRGYLTIVDGLENRAASNIQGPAAERSMATLLSGTALAPGATAGTPSGGGVSLDQLVAQVGGMPALVLGAGTNGLSPALATPSYTGAGMAAQPVTDLTDTVTRLFAAGGLAPRNEALVRQRLAKASLDATVKNLQFLRTRVGTDDARRLDQHTDSVRELAARITARSPVCTAPAAVPTPDPRHLFEAGRTAMDLAVAAFACDRARVATLVYEGADGNAIIGGVARGHHDLAVAAATDAGARTSLAAIETMFMGELAYLLNALGARAEGSRSLLDNTLVLWCSDVSSTSPVSWKNMPCLLAGRAGGALQPGRLVRATASWNQLLTSVAVMFGAGKQVGDPTFGAGPVPGL
jgi:hypothetical protein